MLKHYLADRFFNQFQIYRSIPVFKFVQLKMCKMTQRADLNKSNFKRYATFKNINKESTHLAHIKLLLAVPILTGTL